MGWDVVQIGLKHDLPVHDPYECAKEMSKRLNRNIWLVARNEYEYDVNANYVDTAKGDEFIELGRYRVNESDNFVRMIATAYQAKQIEKEVGMEMLKKATFSNDWAKMIIDDLEDGYELYELEDYDGDYLFIQIFEETIELDVLVVERWRTWEWSFHTELPKWKNWLLKYREQILERAQAFGCEHVIICSDQGPTQDIYVKMNWKANDLLKYTLERTYVTESPETKNTKEWLKHGKIIYFSDFFDNRVHFKEGDFVDIVLEKL